MNAPYEKRHTDFSYRDDDGSNITLACGAHLHYHIEIAYIESGHVDAYVDSELYGLEAGDMVVVFPNRIHRFDCTGKEQYKLFIISPDLVPDLSHRLKHEAPQCPVIKHADKNKRLLSLIDILSETDKILPQGCRDIPKDAIMKGYLLAFFGEMLGMMPTSRIRADESQAIRAILDYCSQNFKQDISLSSIEDEIHLSKYYISHLFGDKLGVSFNEYVNSLRVSEACRHLRSGTYSITEISAMSGFCTLRTFNRAFARQMGMSPSQYRQLNRRENA